MAMSPTAGRAFAAIGIFGAGLLILVGAILLLAGRGPEATRPSTVGGPFSLTDQTGRTVTERDLLGRPHLVFFGFTHCPDICPTKLFEISQILAALGRDGGRVGVVFVTVDPERDTADLLRTYLESFDPRIRGLTGSPEAIEATIRAYRAFARKVPLDGGGYTMDHTAVVYLFDRDGRFVAPFDVARNPEAAAADLRRHL